MGETIKLTAADGHEFDAYKATPDGNPKGAIVVIQEIFGVNQHIRDVTDSYAKEGYLAIAPALFDRWEKGRGTGITCLTISPSGASSSQGQRKPEPGVGRRESGA